MAWWHFYIAIDLSKNDSFASYNSTCKLSNGDHCTYWLIKLNKQSLNYFLIVKKQEDCMLIMAYINYFGVKREINISLRLYVPPNQFLICFEIFKNVDGKYNGNKLYLFQNLALMNLFLIKIDTFLLRLIAFELVL